MNFNWLIVGFLLAWLASSSLLAQAVREDSPFKKARPLTAPGESSHLYLVPSGLSVNPFLNDLWGDTDKLLTGGAHLRHLKEFSDSSLHTSLNWRFFVPAHEPKHGATKLDPAPGHYADWLALQTSWAHMFAYDEQAFKVQLTGGIAHIGDHGASEVHSFMHKIIGADLKGLDYTQQPEGYHAEYGAEIAWIPSFLNRAGQAWENQLALGTSNYRVLYERWASWNAIYNEASGLKYGLEYRFVKQLKSDTFADYRDHRHELTLGVAINPYYTPNILFVSPYVKGDNYAQIYISLFSFNIPL